MNIRSALGKWTVIAGCVAGAVFLLSPRSASSQTLPDDSTSKPEPDQKTQLATPSAEAIAEETNRARIERTTRAMGVLLSWSILNIGVGTAGHFLSDGRAQAFHQMNAGWNVVNAIIAAAGLFSLRREDPTEPGLVDTLEEGRSLEKVLLLNTGLNIAYITTGAYLWERGLRTDSERLRGWGPSLMVQGGFLLLFDSTLYLLQNRASNDYATDLRMHWNDGPSLSYELRF